MTTPNAEQIRWQRFRRSGLAEPFDTAEAAARALVGVQAQIPSAAGVAFWNRLNTFRAADLDTLLDRQRTLVRLWGQRHTMHIYAADDWPIVCAAVSAGWYGNSTPDEDGPYALQVARSAALLAERGSLGRSDLRANGFEDAQSLSPWGGVFSELVRRGLGCHVAREGEARLAARSAWLPNLAWEPPEYDAANIALVRRYLTTYGPATTADIGTWRGAYAYQVKPWLAAMPDLEAVTIDGKPGWRIGSEPLEDPPARWPVRLLGRFDPMLLSMRDKSWVVDPAYKSRVWIAAGHVEATVLVRGRVAGTWRYERTPKGIRITVWPFKPFGKQVTAAVERQAARVADHFGVPLTGLTYPEA